MRKTTAIDVLFGRRNKPDREFSLTPMQAALHKGLSDLMARPEAVQVGGLTQFLPLLVSTLHTTSDEQLREGRELMRTLVQALDDADREPDNAATEETTRQREAVAAET